MTDLYSLLKQFNAIGGMAQTGQSGFCLLMALWQKANELRWINQFTMTNTELLYKAGFNTEKTLIQVRNKLTQLGYFEYIRPKNRRQCGTYILEFNLINLLKVSSEVSNEVSSEVSSEVNINKLNDTKLNETDIEDDNAREEINIVFKIWEQNIGLLSPIIIQKLADWRKDMPDDVICKAIEIAVLNNARKWGYVNTTLNNWYTQNLRSLDAIETEERNRRGLKNNEASSKNYSEGAGNKPEGGKYAGLHTPGLT